MERLSFMETVTISTRIVIGIMYGLLVFLLIVWVKATVVKYKYPAILPIFPVINAITDNTSILCIKSSKLTSLLKVKKRKTSMFCVFYP